MKSWHDWTEFETLFKHPLPHLLSELENLIKLKEGTFRELKN